MRGTFSKEVELGIAQHHERENGQGYQCGLGVGEISIYGRIAAIAESGPCADISARVDGIFAIKYFPWPKKPVDTVLNMRII